MSKFSGKFDFCDEISILGLDAVLRSDVYVGGSHEPLRLTCLADCVPYYPYVPGVVAYNSVTGRGTIRLTEKSRHRPRHYPAHRKVLGGYRRGTLRPPPMV